MQKRGRPPAPVPTEQVTVRLEAEMVRQFRKARGVSTEIQERLFRSVGDDKRDQEFRMFAGKLEKLASDVQRALGARWYEDKKAHAVFIEITRRMLADLPQPSAEISDSRADVQTAADILYNRYVGEQREIASGGKPKIRVSQSVRYGAAQIPEDKS